MEVLDLLGYNDLYGEDKLITLKRYGETAKLTDLALIKGGYVSPFEDKKLLTYQWTKSPSSDGNVQIVDAKGKLTWDTPMRRYHSIRPVIRYSLVKDYIDNVYYKDGVLYAVFGKYYQSAVESKLQIYLTELVNEFRYKPVLCNVCFDRTRYDNYDIPFSKELDLKYYFPELDDSFIFTRVNSCYNEVTLSNNVQYKRNEKVWIKKEPVTWLLDERKDKMVTRDCLLSGIQFDDKEYKGNFIDTNLSKYMNKCMLNDLIEDEIINEQLKSKVRKLKK